MVYINFSADFEFHVHQVHDFTIHMHEFMDISDSYSWIHELFKLNSCIYMNFRYSSYELYEPKVHDLYECQAVVYSLLRIVYTP